MTPTASVIIPTFNHAQWLPEAIESALAQTVSVEVIVVDDASTDRTKGVLDMYRDRIQVVTQPSTLGPSAARNRGLDMATGEYVMFLDADDIIAPQKIEREIGGFLHDTGWVFCDTRIVDDDGRETTASAQYAYRKKELGGWIQPLLTAANFIPVMAPLIRRSYLPDDIRFGDARPEDWFFWLALAGVARVRYVPEVLATYRRHRTGRNREPLPTKTAPVPAPPTLPAAVSPLRLNLGCGAPDAQSWHPLPGLVNLDPALDGWRFEAGLDYPDQSVTGITISHALMYVARDTWPSVLRECYRVLVEGGVLRLTEDDTVHPESARRGGWKGSQPAVTLTYPDMARTELEAAGFVAIDVTCGTTTFGDDSLQQAFHGTVPDVFFIEGVKPPSVLFSPHNDDETLFAAYTLLKYRPRVVVCYPSEGDYGDPGVREAESRAAIELLGAGPFEQWQGGDLVAQMRAFDARVSPQRVWAPHQSASHPQHVVVAKAARKVFGDRLRTYHTYNVQGKVVAGTEVPALASWPRVKATALLCYRTQLEHERAAKFFEWDLTTEYSGSNAP